MPTSSNELAISVRGLSKAYAIQRNQSKRISLTEALVGYARRTFGNAEENTLWALQDVSFDVRRGEIVGIVGRNGAGKSTLLKILSRITKPTRGEIDLYGRVGSLLEVGTGFHQELTGRENIFLSGTILGMKRQEIRKQFDAIVDFAGVEQFLDTPVKRYSSGMYVRLAFGVAAHLDIEILIVDEVLAVGDAEFQRKCLGKMQQVAKGEGRTVLFVSHNMAAVHSLCQRGVWLDDGRVQAIDTAAEVVTAYLANHTEEDGVRHWKKGEQPGNEKLRLRTVRVQNGGDGFGAQMETHLPFFVEITYEIFVSVPELRVSFQLATTDGSIAFQSNDDSTSGLAGQRRSPGVYVSRCEVPGGLVNDIQYLLNVSADIPSTEVIFFAESVLSFQVERRISRGGRMGEKFPGTVHPDLNWEVSRVNDPVVKVSYTENRLSSV